jgi:UDP-N-acetylglucosamine:LPS N-acetylglucosamine transferase
MLTSNSVNVPKKKKSAITPKKRKYNITPGPKKKKVVILYAKEGKGHLAATLAIKGALEKYYNDKVDVEIVDLFRCVNKNYGRTLEGAYNKSIKYMPSAYKAFFELSDQKWLVKFFNQLNYPIIWAPMKKVINMEPDILVSTFPMWDYITARIWKKKKKTSKYITVITDSIAIHTAWMIADADFRIVPNEDTAKVLMDNGVDPENIKIFGFPVDLTFNEKIEKEKIIKSLGLNPKLFTVLLFATVGNNKQNVSIFEKTINGNRDYNVICVTGRNHTIMPKIKHFEKERNVKIMGWVDNVPELMKTSDLIITKAGGATVMECVAAKKPMIITQIIPGQEEGNAELVNNHGLGVTLEKGKKGINKIPEHISEIRNNYKKYKAALEKQSKPDSAVKLADFIISELE